jgi:hypothetical protein
MGLLRLQRHISLQRSRVGLFLYQTSALSIRLVTLEQFKGSVMNPLSPCRLFQTFPRVTDPVGAYSDLSANSLADPPPPPAHSEGFAASQQWWANKHEFLSLRLVNLDATHADSHSSAPATQFPISVGSSSTTSSEPPPPYTAMRSR